MNVILPYVGNFRDTEIFAIFTIKHQLVKFVPMKIFSSKMFLLTSRAQCLRVTDPVNCQKVHLFCCRSIKQTAEIFCNLRSTRCNCEYILGDGNLTIVSTLKMHAVGHHFHAENCRGAVRHCDLVAKIKFLILRVRW